MNIIIFLIILLVLVLVHEWGHFFTAKRFGIRVDEFGFGFPPKIFGIKRGETEYTVNALPFGGFVKIFGENPDEENTNGPDSARSFVNKPRWQQAIVLVAGVFMNFVLAWVLLSIGFMSGLPTSLQSAPKDGTIQNANLTIVSVVADSPAELAGLKTGDKIVYLGDGNKDSKQNEKLDFIEAPNITPETLRDFVVNHKEVKVGYLRGKTNEMHIISVVPNIEEGQPMIGIAMDTIGILKLSPLYAFIEGAKLTAIVTRDTVVGIYTLIANGVQGKGDFNQVTGPVGMVRIVGDAYDFGFIYLLSFAALISINLGVINLVPFPALDGGRLLFLLIEKIKGSRIRARTANIANMAGFAILIALMLLVTYHDILKLF